MSLWTCELCDWQGLATQKSGHKAWRCPKQGALKRNLEKRAKAVEALPCGCGCGAQIPQVKGQKKCHFLHGHYEAWRSRQRAEETRRRKKIGARAAEEAQREREERRLAEEMAPIVTMEEATERAARAVAMVTGEDSFRLWARCLGFHVDGAPTAA